MRVLFNVHLSEQQNHEYVHYFYPVFEVTFKRLSCKSPSHISTLFPPVLSTPEK